MTSSGATGIRGLIAGTAAARFGTWLAAASQWSTAGMFAAALRSPDAKRDAHLAALINLEGIAVAAVMLLGGFMLVGRPRSGRAALPFWGLAGLLAAGMSASAHGILGWRGVAEFAGLVALTSGSLLLARGNRVALGVELSLRLVLALLALSLSFTVAGVSPEFADRVQGPVAPLLLAGVVYFSVLGAIEASGLYAALRRVTVDN